ncbi:hypothetical protein AB0H92_23065 [Streptomyces phaeochromogenes]|uniref:hypothetical protein n=1 Tax=Streptomyces phaeochromogenes TaxID=1923 RepID=UPI0033E773C1
MTTRTATATGATTAEGARGRAGRGAALRARSPFAAQAADDLGLSHQTVMTIAGHDSVNMKDVAPAIMLFVPSVEGVSHNEGEFTQDVETCAGTDLLAEVLHRLMSGALDSSG